MVLEFHIRSNHCSTIGVPSSQARSYIEHFPSLQVVVQMLGAAAPGDGGHSEICEPSVIYFSRCATSRGPKIPVLIKICAFCCAAQLIHAEYCFFTSPGLSPHFKTCHVPVTVRGSCRTHNPELSSVRIVCRKQIEENRGTVGSVVGGPGGKQRQRGDLGGKWVERKKIRKGGRQIPMLKNTRCPSWNQYILGTECAWSSPHVSREHQSM